MHQCKLNFDIDLSVNDITTLVQRLIPDLAGTKRERDTIQHLLGFFF